MAQGTDSDAVLLLPLLPFPLPLHLSNAVSPPVPLVPAWITAHTALGFHKHIAGGARGAVDLLLTFDVHITITVQVLHRLSALADDALMQ